MTINSANNYTITTSCGTSITSGSYHLDIEENSITEYIDFIAEILGIDINYEKFKKMSVSEKKSLIRDIKINKIIK